MVKEAFIWVTLLVLGYALGKPSEVPESDGGRQNETSNLLLAGARETTPSEKENLGRLILSQVGTMMCYRAWEINPSVDFHFCNVCFNETHQPGKALSNKDFVSQSEGCFNKYLSDSYFKECLPMLRDPAIPNKPYDILVSEPSVDFSYRNFARCAHGAVFKIETAKCVKQTEAVVGSEPFLNKFACLLKNLIVESKRFSEANLKELLGSVPKKP